MMELELELEFIRRDHLILEMEGFFQEHNLMGDEYLEEVENLFSQLFPDRTRYSLTRDEMELVFWDRERDGSLTVTDARAHEFLEFYFDFSRRQVTLDHFYFRGAHPFPISKAWDSFWKRLKASQEEPLEGETFLLRSVKAFEILFPYLQKVYEIEGAYSGNEVEAHLEELQSYFSEFWPEVLDFWSLWIGGLNAYLMEGLSLGGDNFFPFYRFHYNGQIEGRWILQAFPKVGNFFGELSHDGKTLSLYPIGLELSILWKKGRR